MKINKIASINEKDIPEPGALAAYVKVLKLYLDDNTVTPKFKRLIENLPSPRTVKSKLSWEECKILFITINYLWKNIIGKDILEENYIDEPKQELLGNYWLFKNGIMINGENHYTAIERDSSLVITVLGLNGITLQYYLSTSPNKLINYILKNGGVRVFINADNKGFFQMTEKTYAQWGRGKVRKYDLKTKIVRIIDLKMPYNGWKSGIPIKL